MNSSYFRSPTIYTTAIALLTTYLIHASAVQAAAPLTAIMSLAPTTGTFLTGALFGVDVKLNTGGQAVSAVNVAIQLGGNIQYVSSDVSGSVFSAEVNAPTLNGSTLNFARARFDTGFTSTSGVLIHLTLRAASNGTGTLSIDQPNSEADAYADSSNILQSVTGLAYTIKDPSLNVQLALPGRTSLSQSGINLQVVQPGTVTPVATLTNVTSGGTGLITSNDSTFVTALSDSSTYDIRLTVPGYLIKRVSNVTNILSQQVALPGNSQLYAGDFDGNNMITVADLTTMIRAYHNGSDTAAQLAKQTFNGTVTLANLVTVIFNLNTTPQGA